MNDTRLAKARPFSPGGAKLVVITGAAAGASVPVPAAVGHAVLVGKGEQNDLILPDDTVSRQHLEVVRARDGIVVRDLGSTNGVRIGGARVTEALVEPGAVVSLGEVDVVVRLEPDTVDIPPSEASSFGRALGTSLTMRRIFALLERIAPSMATVLITGETGTGKDVLAQAIHDESPRRDGPFEVFDCGAIAPHLVESELFGHERGAFTGAVATHAGVFERAAGGTLFLDEIGELPLDLQPKLLRVLEARELRRVGGSRTLTTDVRIVAATKRDLVKEVQAGRFREDLYFRLAVVPLEVPPLRHRPEDIPLLAQRILTDLPGTPQGLSDDDLQILLTHGWPGNVRELRNVLERAAFLNLGAGDGSFRLPNLRSASLPGEREEADAVQFDARASYRDTRAAFERKYVTWLLARHRGNISAAAREARMDRKHLSDLAKKHRDGSASAEEDER
jgi:DNA-binding NtrC family response regulator